MKKICFVSGSSPEFLGGVSLYQRNLINYAKKQKLDLEFTWIYSGKRNRKYNLKDIGCIEIKSFKYPILKEFSFAKKVERFLYGKKFDIINTHANWGYCLKKYKKKKDQEIVHTYHGVTNPYMKVQFARFGFLKYLFYPFLPFFYFIEKPPIKKADKIICVSEKVKKELGQIYNSNKNMEVIRTGVNLNQFKEVSKGKNRKELKLDKDKIYGLYSGRGGYWNKGLDRVISLGREIYKKNKKFKLIVLGAEKENCEKYLEEKFVIHKGIIDREKISKYYSACDLFFCLSRSEGGAPTLVVGEAMASGCFIVFSEDSKQEIIENEKEGLIINTFGENSAKKILEILGNKKLLKKIQENSKKKIKNFNLDSWGEKYFGVLLK